MKKTASTVVAVLSGALALGASSGEAAEYSAPAEKPTTQHAPQAYLPYPGQEAQNERARARVQEALKAYNTKGGQKSSSEQAATTVYYSVTNAPTYASYIRQGASIWNSSVSNVKLVENSSAATLKYYEGSDPKGKGSHYSGNMHGSGYILLDPAQMNVYSKTRIASHETGHALGLYDNYSGPCSELMSGGGQPPSCTNAYPNATERQRVQALWANGFAASPTKTPQAAPKVLATK